MDTIKHTIVIKHSPRTDGELLAAVRAIIQLPKEVPEKAKANALRDLTSYSAGIFQLEASRYHLIDREPVIIPPPHDVDPDKVWRLVWP